MSWKDVVMNYHLQTCVFCKKNRSQVALHIFNSCYWCEDCDYLLLTKQQLLRFDRCFSIWTCQIELQFEARARCLFKAELQRLLPTYEVGDCLCRMVGDLKQDILFAFITVVLPRAYELKAKPGWYSQFVDQL
jgi:hypothetical protein